jgi:hypothetical protein
MDPGGSTLAVTVRELRDALANYPDDYRVVVAYQPRYPLRVEVTSTISIDEVDRWERDNDSDYEEGSVVEHHDEEERVVFLVTPTTNAYLVAPVYDVVADEG